MKAMVVETPAPVTSRPLIMKEVADPQPGPGEVRVRVAACGVCRTDLHVVEGELVHRLPIVPGHQVVGVVDMVGEQHDPGSVVGPRPAVGDRVGIPWLYRSCGVCRYCLQGEENLCEGARFTGLDHDGGYAEYVVVPSDFAVPLPRTLDDVQVAPLLCAGIIGFRSLRVAGLRPGERLGLFGFGASAHIAVQIARYWGCEVFVFTRSEHHQGMALRLGASWAGSAGQTPPAQVDRAVTFAPAGFLIPEALKVLRRGGVLAINAVHLDGIPAFPYELIYWEKTVRSVANATREDALDFLELAWKIPVKTEVQTFGLEETNEALIALKRGGIQGAAVLRVCSR